MVKPESKILNQAGPAFRVHLVLGLALGLACLAGSRAQADIVCQAEVNRHEVPVGQDVVLTVSVQGGSGWSADFQLPKIAGVVIYAGGTNQSISMINGRTQASVTRTYYLRAGAVRDYTIGPVTVSGGGQTCRTDPIAIKVLPSTAHGNIPPVDSGNRQPPPSGDSSGERLTTSSSAGRDLFVSLEVDHDDAWVGQQIVLRFRYWRRTQPWANPTYEPPRTEGFWREDLGSERNYRENVGGRIYNVTELRYALFPTRAGRLVIEPAQLVFAEDVFDRFFSSRLRPRGPRVLRTDSLIITVKNLPEPKPENFSSIVGSRLDLSIEADRDSVPRGEAVGLKIQLGTDGFLKGFAGLPIPEPPAATMYDAAENLEVGVVEGRLQGKYTTEKVVLPDEVGLMTIPPLAVPWFDTRRGSFRVARTAALTVVVAPSDLPQVGSETSGFLRSELARLGQDLAFIHPAGAQLSRRTGPLVDRVAWWSSLLLPLLLLVVWRWIVNRAISDRRDPVGVKRRRAQRVALRGLRKADREQDPVLRLGLYAQAVQGFVGDSLGISATAVGRAEVLEFADRLGKPDLGSRLAEILAACDAVRFGGGVQHQDTRMGGEIGGLLKELNKGLRRRRKLFPSVGTSVLPCLLVALVVGVFSVWAADDLPGVDPQRLLAEGNQAYTDGRLQEALDRYLDAREMGINDAVLHYNLGNTFARRGELGKAIASYLRAQRMAPRDQDIADNLAWVRGHLVDLELIQNPYPLLVKPLVAVIHGLTLDQWSLLLVVLVWLLGVLLALGWYREFFGPWLRRFLLVSAGLFCLVAIIVTWRWYGEEIRNEAVVVVEEAQVRSGPAETFPVLFKVHDGLTLAFASEREGWVRVGLGGDWQGWLPVVSIETVRLP